MEIEKNIPIGAIKDSSNSIKQFCSEVFDNFEIGDSSLIPVNTHEKISCYRSQLDKIVKSNHSNHKYSFKKWDDENYRIWRTK